MNFHHAQKEYHFQFKVVLVGDPSVGKSSFLRRYIHGVSRRNTLPKIEEDECETEPFAGRTFHLDETEKTVTRNDKVVKLTIWDTAGWFFLTLLTMIITFWQSGYHLEKI